jgi:S-adenosylmethionine:tRNA ribosyltransferase-isomerase
LHTGVSSVEGGEQPYPESYDVPAATARLANLTRHAGGRVIAAGTTVVRALETAAALSGGAASGSITASAGWTPHVVTRRSGVAAVEGLHPGRHAPRPTHLWLLAACPGEYRLGR